MSIANGGVLKRSTCSIFDGHWSLLRFRYPQWIRKGRIKIKQNLNVSHSILLNFLNTATDMNSARKTLIRMPEYLSNCSEFLLYSRCIVDVPISSIHLFIVIIPQRAKPLCASAKTGMNVSSEHSDASTRIHSINSQRFSCRSRRTIAFVSAVENDMRGFLNATAIHHLAFNFYCCLTLSPTERRIYMPPVNNDKRSTRLFSVFNALRRLSLPPLCSSPRNVCGSVRNSKFSTAHTHNGAHELTI